MHLFRTQQSVTLCATLKIYWLANKMPNTWQGALGEIMLRWFSLPGCRYSEKEESHRDWAEDLTPDEGWAPRIWFEGVLGVEGFSQIP